MCFSLVVLWVILCFICVATDYNFFRVAGVDYWCLITLGFAVCGICCLTALSLLLCLFGILLYFTCVYGLVRV